MNENIHFLKDDILKKNNIEVPSFTNKVGSYNLKLRNKFICKHLGGQFYKRLRGVSYDMWIKPNLDIINKYCFYSTGFVHYYDKNQIMRLWNKLKIVKIVYEDELHNIGPYVVFFGKSPKFLKYKLGKGIWKQLCRNSLTKNKNIVMCMEHDLNDNRIKSSPKNYTKYVSYLKVCAYFKSSFIKYMPKVEFEKYHTWKNNLADISKYLQWLNKYSKVSDSRDININSDIYNDTKRMCSLYNLKFKQWSLNKMIEQHDILTKRTLQREYSKNKFEWLSKLDNKYCFNNVEATVLKSPYDIALEATEMHHCVASYINHVDDKKYIVISLKKTGIRSTVGIFIRNSKFELGQHYGKCNDYVNDDEILEAVPKLIKAINDCLPDTA